MNKKEIIMSMGFLLFLFALGFILGATLKPSCSVEETFNGLVLTEQTITESPAYVGEAFDKYVECQFTDIEEGILISVEGEE